MTLNAGLLLAAGAGRRMGIPKGLLRDSAGIAFLDRALRSMFDGGCDTVSVVVGAASEEVVAVLGEAGWTANEAVAVVLAADWDEGMGASLRSGLAALSDSSASSVLVTLVDLPDVDAHVVRRVLDAGGQGDVLMRAAYDGVPGHPVLIGRDHFHGVIETAYGDRGARDYLRAHRPTLIECGDLATGRDVDRPEDL